MSCVLKRTCPERVLNLLKIPKVTRPEREVDKSTYFFAVALQPNDGHGLLIHEVF